MHATSYIHAICTGGTHRVGLADVGTSLEVPPVNLVDDRGLGQLRREIRHTRNMLRQRCCASGRRSSIRCYREEIVVALQLLRVR